MSRVELIGTLKEFAIKSLDVRNIDIYVSIAGHVWLRINKPFEDPELYLLGNSGDSSCTLKEAILKLKEIR